MVNQSFKAKWLHGPMLAVFCCCFEDLPFQNSFYLYESPTILDQHQHTVATQVKPESEMLLSSLNNWLCFKAHHPPIIPQQPRLNIFKICRRTMYLCLRTKRIELVHFYFEEFCNIVIIIILQYLNIIFCWFWDVFITKLLLLWNCGLFKLKCDINPDGS